MMETFAQVGHTVHSVVYNCLLATLSSSRVALVQNRRFLSTFAQGGLTVRLVVKTKLTANSLSYSILIDY